MPYDTLQQEPTSPDPPLPRRRRVDEVDLPPTTDSSTEGRLWIDDPEYAEPAGKPKGRLSLLGGIAMVGALAAGGWMMLGGSSLEKQHPNWQHVTAATQASDTGSDQVLHIDGSGITQIVTSVDVSYRDIDRATTRKVRSFLGKGDLFAATAALQAAQNIPTSDPATRPPEIKANSALAAALEDRDNELFGIQLYDCCAEDGDVVEVLVNDVPFATVPISHQGATLSIPLAKGSNTVTIRGLSDGGGGITVSFRTSRGSYFCRSMFVGEEYPIGVIVK